MAGAPGAYSLPVCVILPARSLFRLPWRGACSRRCNGSPAPGERLQGGHNGFTVHTSTVPPVAFMRYPLPRVLFRLHGAGAPLPACPLPPVALPACAHHRAGRGHFHPFPGVAVMRGASPCSPFTDYPWRLLPAQGVRGHSLPARVVSACSRLPRA